MFHEPTQPEDEKQAPCEACGRPAPFEVWGHAICGPCVAEWQRQPVPEVCRVDTPEAAARYINAPDAVTSAAWRAACDAWVRDRKASAA